MVKHGPGQEVFKCIPGFELQNSGIQASRFKIPGESFHGILNPGSRSFEIQNPGLNFKTPGSRIQDPVETFSWDLES